MAIQDLRSIGELVASVATIATLGYLAVQTPQSAQLVSPYASVAWGGCVAALARPAHGRLLFAAPRHVPEHGHAKGDDPSYPTNDYGA